MVGDEGPLINPIYTLYSGYLLGISPFKGLLEGLKQLGLFQSDVSKSVYGKWLEITISIHLQNLLCGVPGMYCDFVYLPSWERSHIPPFKGTFESMIFLPPGRICDRSLEGRAFCLPQRGQKEMIVFQLYI